MNASLRLPVITIASPVPGFPVWGLTQGSKQNGSPETLGLGFDLYQRVSGFPCSTPCIKAVLCVKGLPVVGPDPSSPVS